MSSINVYIHTQGSCHMHDQAPAQRPDADKALRQGLAAVIVLALLERLMQGAQQGGCKHEHAKGADAGQQVDRTRQASGSTKGDESAMGVLKPFLELLLLLALLCKQGGGKKQGAANPLADKVADQLANGTDKGGSTPQGLAQDGGTTDGFESEDAVAMMVRAMREGHAASLMAGKDDADFERQLQQMSSELREELDPPAETESETTGSTGTDSGANTQNTQN